MSKFKSAAAHEIEVKTDLAAKGFEKGKVYKVHITTLSGGGFAVFTADMYAEKSGYTTVKTEHELLENFKFTTL